MIGGGLEEEEEVVLFSKPSLIYYMLFVWVVSEELTALRKSFS